MESIDKILEIENETEKMLAIAGHLWKKSRHDNNFESLNEEEKAILYIEMMEGQVNNGGFHQYFFNYSGEYAYETVDALKKINANKTATLLENAIRLFPVLPVKKDTDTRRIEMMNLNEKVNEKWEELGDKFYLYEDNLAQLVMDFVVNNKRKFE